ncbi:MAG: hypothetical protein ACRDYA_08855 [Egibacteraceae bacterium]
MSWPRRSPWRSPRAPGAPGCQGLLGDDPDVLLAAVAAYRQGPRPIDRAFACEDAGVALGRAGRVPEALPLLVKLAAEGLTNRQIGER